MQFLLDFSVSIPKGWTDPNPRESMSTHVSSKLQKTLQDRISGKSTLDMKIESCFVNFESREEIKF
jgi:hypothetical protein